MRKEEVQNLAKLARIDITDEEAESLTHEFDSILGYVGEVKEVSSKQKVVGSNDKHPVRNVMREDKNPHESGMYTQEILAQAPSREGEYIKVKKIL